MPYMLEDLVVDRVDLVDEGANSEAFIELYKRKEQSKMGLEEILGAMKPEHAEVVTKALEDAKQETDKAKEDLEVATAERDEATRERDEATEALKAANEDLENTKSELDTLRAAEAEANKAAFDETETLKSMPEEVRAMFETIRTQKEAAETELRKAKEAEKTAEAIAKAKEFKAIPVEQETLVGIVKNASSELLDLLTVVNAAIEGTVLDEVGKNHTGDSTGADAWSKIESKADEVVKSQNVTKAKAVSIVIKENPELYKEYLQGGAN